jgi:hypothetical protein
VYVCIYIASWSEAIEGRSIETYTSAPSGFRRFPCHICNTTIEVYYIEPPSFSPRPFISTGSSFFLYASGIWGRMIWACCLCFSAFPFLDIRVAVLKGRIFLPGLGGYLWYFIYLVSAYR